MPTTTMGLLKDEFGSTMDDLIARGPIFWDDDLSAWIVTRYDEAAYILRDDDTFTRDDRFRPGGAEFWRKGLAGMEGETHRRVHSFHSRYTGNAFSESIRASVIRPLADRLITPLVAAGRADLATQYADVLPMLVGCTFMGFEIEDDAFRTRLVALARVRDKWKESFLSGAGCALDSPIAVAGAEAVDGLYDLFLPTIRARRDNPASDLISVLWEHGLRAFPDWSEDDMMGACWSDVFGGETKLLMRNMFYVLVSDPELFGGLRDGFVSIVDFVEESLRFLGPVRSLNKLITKDTTIGDQPVRQGQRVYVVIAAANRDSSKWDAATSMRVGRDGAEANLSFGQGPRYCVGRYLARVVAAEATGALVAAARSVEFDPDEPGPAWQGVHTRSVSPLHVVLRG